MNNNERFVNTIPFLINTLKFTIFIACFCRFQYIKLVVVVLIPNALPLLCQFLSFPEIKIFCLMNFQYYEKITQGSWFSFDSVLRRKVVSFTEILSIKFVF